MTFWLRRARLAAAALALAAVPAAAQESLLELTHRGPELRGAIEALGLIVESMDVSIGLQNSVLKYRISNPTAAPVATVLTMPLPDLDFSDPDDAWSIPGPDPVNFVSLTATVDQKPAALSFSQVARIDEKDISAVLRRSGLPLVPVGTFQNQLAMLTPEAKARLAKDGLIAEAGTDQGGHPLYFPRWSVRTTASRKLDLAPGQSFVVEFRFRTSVGVSRDSVLREPLRSEKGLAREVERRRVDYCLDRGFFGGVDKIVSTAVAQLTRPPEQIGWPQGDGEPERSGGAPQTAAPLAASDAPRQPTIRVFPEANVANLHERRIAFDLGTDAPSAPLRQFRLTVDKGRPTRIVSFCLNNLKKISATGFEMRASDYRPSGALKILLVGPKD